MPLPFIIGGALAGGAINALSDLFSSNSQNANINKYENLLRDSKLSSGDITLGNKKIERFYNASITNLMNRSAINTGGVLNAPTVKAATVAPLAGQSAMAQANYDERAQARNEGIDRQIAAAELGRPTNNVLGDFFGGAVSGGIAGAQISSLFPKSDKVINNLTTSATTHPDTSLPMGGEPKLPLVGNTVQNILPKFFDTVNVNTPTKTKVSDVNLGGGGRVEQPLPPLEQTYSSNPTHLQAIQTYNNGDSLKAVNTYDNPTPIQDGSNVFTHKRIVSNEQLQREASTSAFNQENYSSLNDPNNQDNSAAYAVLNKTGLSDIAAETVNSFLPIGEIPNQFTKARDLSNGEIGTSDTRFLTGILGLMSGIGSGGSTYGSGKGLFGEAQNLNIPSNINKLSLPYVNDERLYLNLLKEASSAAAKAKKTVQAGWGLGQYGGF